MLKHVFFFLQEVLYLTATLHFPDRKASQHVAPSASSEKSLVEGDADYDTIVTKE